MAIHEKVLREMLNPGQVKALCSAAVEGVPPELPKETADWWLEHGRVKILAAAIKKRLNCPPVLGFAVRRWEAFYHQIFHLRVHFRLPKDWAMLDSENWICVSPDLDYKKLAWCCHRLWPTIFVQHVDNYEFEDLLKPGGDTYRHESGKSYLLRIEPDPGPACCTPNDAGELTFKEIAIQQIFRCWCGDELDDDLHYAVGTRCDGRVPSLKWSGTELHFGTFQRSEVNKDQWRCQLCVI